MHLEMQILPDGEMDIGHQCLGKWNVCFYIRILVEEIIHEWNYHGDEQNMPEPNPHSIDSLLSPSKTKKAPVIILDEEPRKLKSLCSSSKWTFVDSKTALLRLTRALSEKGLREKELKTRLAEKMRELGYWYDRSYLTLKHVFCVEKISP